jgi:hypothetical protein
MVLIYKLWTTKVKKILLMRDVFMAGIEFDNDRLNYYTLARLKSYFYAREPGYIT